MPAAWGTPNNAPTATHPHLRVCGGEGGAGVPLLLPGHQAEGGVGDTTARIPDGTTPPDCGRGEAEAGRGGGIVCERL